MNIEKIEIARVNLIGYGFPDFNIMIVPGSMTDGTPTFDCFLTKNGFVDYFYMFGSFGSMEEAAELAYGNVPQYLPLFVAQLLKDDE
jgi:hypothetical protein